MGFLLIIGWLFKETSSYLGLFIFIIVPALMIFGLILIPVGMYFKAKRLKKGTDKPDKKKYPVLDLNIPRSRNAVLIFSTGTLLLMLFTGLGSYEAFHYSESVDFCGKLCHSVMNPMHVAYHNSPHARVACVECHVGSGADWYVRSKLSGLRQVYGVLTDSYETPIGHPIKDLRPARETCEHCHWPEKFYTHQLWNDKTYLADSANTEWNITMQIKTGPSHSALGLTEGIHWHINKNTKIEFISRDEFREDIPWVRFTDLETNQVTIYENDDPLSEEDIASAKIRTMDCIDCHNRPSHNYETPMKFVDDAITRGDIPLDLPYIKKVAMDIFLETFTNTDTAIAKIKEYTYSFYKEEMPEVYETRKKDIDRAVDGIIYGFNNNIFPEMEVSWDVYPNHIGHKTYNGCFRCHDGKHISKSEEEPIRRDCNLCHNIVKQGKPGEEVYSNLDVDLEFIHPVKFKGEEWRQDNCSECHRYLY
jgi:hypothetical protein